MRNGRISSEQLTQACLQRIERLNPILNAFVAVTGAEAMEQARTADREIAGGKYCGPLHGIPLGIKDNIDTAGIRTTAGSRAFAQRIPTEDAEVVARLKAAGSVLLGKLNMDEFALGTTGVTSCFGPCRNPWDLMRSPGGSSGGAAAAVATGMCFGAIGTDSGGSVRLPAACCGLVGFKGTFGLVSGRGVVPLSWAFQHIGPITRTVDDAAILMQTIAGYDPRDPDSVDTELSALMQDTVVPESHSRPIRIGVIRNYVPDEKVGPVFELAIEILRIACNAELHDIVAPELPAAADAIWPAEVWLYHRSLIKKSGALYHPTVRRVIQSWNRSVTADMVEARRQLTLDRRNTARLFDGFDVLVSPTAPCTALPFSECRTLNAYPTDFTTAFNMWGLPAISIPCGFADNGMPVSLQVIGPHFGEQGPLSVARRYERATNWHTMRPPLE